MCTLSSRATASSFVERARSIARRSTRAVVALLKKPTEVVLIIGPAQPSHPDAVTYLRAASAFRRRDLDAITETIHESVVWHLPGTSWVGRTVEGRTALLAFLKEIVARTGNTFVLEDRSISGTDHHVVALQRLGATVAGDTQMFECVSIMRFEGGRQLERWLYVPEQDAFDTFFARFP
jgi:ketosteroid isomerase-like protein